MSDARIEAFLADVLALEGENQDACILLLLIASKFSKPRK